MANYSSYPSDMVLREQQGEGLEATAGMIGEVGMEVVEEYEGIDRALG